MPKSISGSDLALFVRQLKSMVDSGVPLLRALEFYADADEGELGRVVRECAIQVRTGKYLSRAMASFPDVFSPVVVGLVSAAEKTGGLHLMLGKMAEMLERNSRIERKLASSFTYPIFLLAMSLVVGGVFIFTILPTMEPMFSSVGMQPPLPTRGLMAAGRFLRSPLAMGAAVALVMELYLHGPLVWAKLREHPKRRLFVDRLPFVLPVISKVTEQVVGARIMMTMATALEVGFPADKALELASAVTTNEFARNSLLEAQRWIHEGESLSSALARTALFSPMVAQLIALGEEAASISTSLRYLVSLYEENAELALENAVALLEPVMLFVMGIVAGFLILASFLPIVRMLEAL